MVIGCVQNCQQPRLEILTENIEIIDVVIRELMIPIKLYDKK